MVNVATASKEQVDWAIGIIDMAGEGGEVDADDFFKASAVLTVVSYAAFELAGENERLQAELKVLNHVKDEAALTFEIISPDILDVAERFPLLLRHTYRMEIEVKRLRAEVKRLKAKANRFLDDLENEGLYQDYDEYVALKESLDDPTT